jgi:monothiol glutaredoxin
VPAPDNPPGGPGEVVSAGNAVIFSAGISPRQSGVEEAVMDTQEMIKKQVSENPVVLYMKGTPDAPMCGFSAAAVQILEACGADNVATVNVLADDNIRQGIKDFSQWPTIPQLYVNGEFVGGADIMREMYQSGELHKLFQK